MSFPYYKRYPAKFFEKTRTLPWEIKGIYSMLIDLIMMTDNDLTDEAGYIAGQLGCTKNRWTIAKKVLLKEGKIKIVDGKILNNRAKLEQNFRKTFRKTKQENAQKTHNNGDSSQAGASHREEDIDLELSYSSSLGARDWKSLREICIKRAMPALDATATISIPISPLLNLLEADPPALLDRDILPAIDEVVARGHPTNMRNFKYIAKVAIGNRDERLSEIPKPKEKKDGTAKQRNSVSREISATGNGRRSSWGRVLGEGETEGVASKVRSGTG